MTRAGIFGISLSGKTTLAKRISRQFAVQCGRTSLVLDPHEEIYGEHALVFTNEEEFWKTAWEVENKLIIVDEAAATIRRERDLVAVFTRMRHRGHKLIVIGHNGTDLLPVMRQQFDTLYLFRQPEEAAKIWAELFADKKILTASELGQYEYLYCELFKPVVHYKANKP